jgi:hypothetical protein
MTFLPIVARELRVAARRRGTYWVRSGAALGILVVGTWFFQKKRGHPLGSMLWLALQSIAVCCAEVVVPLDSNDPATPKRAELLHGNAQALEQVLDLSFIAIR